MPRSDSAHRDGKPRPGPFTLVIFGATGDLTRRKLVPALYDLFCDGLLPDGFSVVGFARRNKTDDDFRDDLRTALKQFNARFDETKWAAFAPKLFYHASTFESSEGYGALRRRLEGGAFAPKAVFYLAVRPDDIKTVVGQLRDSGLSGCDTSKGGVCAASPWPRVIVEKPFGRDLASAAKLNDLLRSAFHEQQIYRIDHYLGKETVQNILVLRFANSIFEPIWNQKYVDHVQITVSETLGTEGRGDYYEQAGALRDIVQNHLMHLLCLVAMEPPGSLDARDIRDEKVKVLRALRAIPESCALNGVVRAQYAAGKIAGKAAPGYREEEGVAADSTTETFVATKLLIDNWRWSGVPFYIRAGKRLPARITEISVHFKHVPQVLFNTDADEPLEPAVLAIRIQPNEGISLRFQVKVPGLALEIQPFQMDFGYASAFGRQPPDAYERLLLDAALGDPTLFTRSDEVEAAWRFLAPILHCGESREGPLPEYAAGTWGPKEADDLIEADGRKWLVVRRPRQGSRTRKENE